tara:strand:- start:675 stop:884 length:210 start_codon:yes stop_codon:yes gene_type:complete
MIALFLGTGAEHLPSKVRTYKIWLATPFLQDFAEMLNSAQQTGTWDENGEKNSASTIDLEYYARWRSPP